jgi:hypothetical protein
MIVRALHSAIQQLCLAEALTPGQQYSVIGIEADDYRLLNDAGRPYLYPASAFEIVDPKQPERWITETGKEGEHYAYPPELNGPGFFGDFFDHEPAAIATFWRFVNARLAEAD